MSTPAPDAIRYDRGAYTVPESRNMFHAAGPVLAKVELAPAPALALAPAPVVEVAVPVLARAEAPAAVVKPAAPVERVAAAPARASEKLASPAVPAVRKVQPRTSALAKAPAKAVEKAARLGRLVPEPRPHSEFARAFAALETPVDPSQQLDAVLPAMDPARVAAPAADFAASSGPALEVVVPAAPAELPPVSAAADVPEAKL